jgi:hypothetical protein
MMKKGDEKEEMMKKGDEKEEMMKKGDEKEEMMKKGDDNEVCTSLRTTMNMTDDNMPCQTQL